MKTAESWIELLGLTPHPEGGWFREIYRSAEQIPAGALPTRYQGGRAFSTAIYFLLKGGEFSAFHRLKSDEIWIFFEGSPLSIHQISPAGTHSCYHLGPDVTAGRVFQVVISAGTWFGAKAGDKTGFSLVGCTLAPGYDVRDFELARREELLALFPLHRDIILNLTRT